MKSGGVKRVLCVPFLSEIMRLCKRFPHLSKLFEDTKGATKGQSEFVNRRRKNNTMVKRKMIYNDLQNITQKLKNEQHEPH
jgi:hypothetical protein